jgi:hypothetical protein
MKDIQHTDGAVILALRCRKLYLGNQLTLLYDKLFLFVPPWILVIVIKLSTISVKRFFDNMGCNVEAFFVTDFHARTFYTTD